MGPEARSGRMPSPGETVSIAYYAEGLGSKGLQEAQKFWQQEMSSRQPGQAKNPWAIVGSLDGETVYVEHGVERGEFADMRAIPKGREEDVSYSVVVLGTVRNASGSNAPRPAGWI